MWGWVFDNPKRLYRTMAVGATVAFVLLVGTLGYRVHQLNVTAGKLAQAQPVGDPLAQVTSGALPDVDPTSTNLPVTGSETAAIYPQAGDPLPVALDAVNAWLGADYQRLEGLAQPAAYEDLSTHPAAEGTQVDGVGDTTLSGPTASEVRVPTNSPNGDLLVSLVVADDEWKVTAFGWSAQR